MPSPVDALCFRMMKITVLLMLAVAGKVSWCIHHPYTDWRVVWVDWTLLYIDRYISGNVCLLGLDTCAFMISILLCLLKQHQITKQNICDIDN